MAKIKPGPIVQEITGSLGPIVYYRALGRPIARARVSPHQIQTPARAAWRGTFQIIMRAWNHMKDTSSPSWEALPPLYSPAHGKFLQQNTNVGQWAPHEYPQMDTTLPPVSICKTDHLGHWDFTATWDIAAYPGFDRIDLHAWTSVGASNGSAQAWVWDGSRVLEEFTPGATAFVCFSMVPSASLFNPGGRQNIFLSLAEIPEC